MFGEALLHHLAFFAAIGVGRLDIVPPVRAAVKKIPVRPPVIAIGNGAGEQGFIGVDRGDLLAARQCDDLRVTLVTGSIGENGAVGRAT